MDDKHIANILELANRDSIDGILLRCEIFGLNKEMKEILCVDNISEITILTDYNLIINREIITFSYLKCLKLLKLMINSTVNIITADGLVVN